MPYAVLLRPLSPAQRRRAFGMAAILFSLAAVAMLWAYGGAAATQWMNVFHPADFTTWPELVAYVANLRVPIPVLLSLAEIADYRLFGQLLLTTRVLYPVAIYLSFLLALWPPSASWLRLGAATVLALVFVWGLRIVHFANPQTYDVLFPWLVMSYVVLLEKAARPGRSPYVAGIIPIGAGLALSLAELTRPFFIYLLPFLALAACVYLRPWGWRRVALFLAPILLLSGSWHLHIARTQGQLAWSNHSGYNLMRSWPMVAIPPLIAETADAPLAPDRWANLNTVIHGQNSRIIQSAVVAYIREHPGQAAGHVLFRLGAFLSIPTGYYNWHPEHPGLWLYRLAAWIGLAWLAAQAIPMAAALLRRDWLAFLAPESQLIAIAAATVLILALAEAGEEARLFVTVLPFLAALPRFGRPRPSTFPTDPLNTGH